MDRRTIEHYDRNAAELAARYRSLNIARSAEQFREAFPNRGARILDVGSGSGRDVHHLGIGCDAFGCEPSEAMRADCVRHYPDLKGRILPFGIPLPEDADTGGEFDGILCSAVLMHVPETELFAVAFSLRRLLRTKGRLLLSVPAAGCKPFRPAAYCDPLHKQNYFVILC
jgi:SAM-dependent methyltransferase